MKKSIHTSISISIILSLILVGPSGIRAELPPQDTSCVGQGGSITWYFWNGIDRGELEYLYAHQFFPQSPDGSVEILSLETPYKFNDDFGSFASGFIKAPESGPYIFNLTGDDECSFYLSDGTDPGNKNRLAWVPDHSGTEEHEKHPEQTSDTIQLVEGQYYYFELHHKENGWTDFAKVWWKTPFYPDTLWTIVHGSYLYDNACFTTCDPQGTVCDDGDSTTVRDRTDGFCNCSGITATGDNCIGDRGSVTALFYDSITGYRLDDLYEDPDYPLAPDRALVLDEFAIPINDANIYGTRIRGYLNVSVSGYYQFNLTADDNTKFFMSTGPSPDSLQELIYIDGWTRTLEHYKYPGQTTDSIYLDKNKYYYLEVHQKEHYGGDHATLFWRPPFRQDTGWTRIDGFFLYPYECETACIPEGTPCDDGSPLTTADAYDDNCNCVGIPCQGPCEDVLDYTKNEFCSSTEQHSEHERDSWLSCEGEASPNPARDTGHWIMYDFGDSYKITGSKYWNYNVEGSTDWGARTVVVDHSEDGQNWVELGSYTWPEASGNTDYSGEVFEALEGLITRYLLITITENRSGVMENGIPDCAGFSEIFFAVKQCEAAGTPCDDGDPLTFNDMFDHECECTGLPLEDNECDTPSLVLDQPTFSSGLFDAQFSVKASSMGMAGSSVTLVAGDSIVLQPGFEVQAGAQFLATIVPCDPENGIQPLQAHWSSLLPAVDKQEYEDRPDHLLIYPNPASGWVNIHFETGLAGKLSLHLFDLSGQKVSAIIPERHYEAAAYQKRLPAHNLEEGIYLLVLESPDGLFKKRLVVLSD